MANPYFSGWDPASTIPLRLAVGVVFIMHGGRTLFVKGVPWFAGYLETKGIPFPMVMAVVASAVEFLGGIALIASFYPRVTALLLACNMVVAFFVAHMTKGFFVQNGGFEYVMVLFAACLVFLLDVPKKRPPTI